MRSDNKIVHAMWVGGPLSRLELLTAHSFLHHGHEFHLWAYDDLSNAGLPSSVRIRDAEQIIPRKDVFAKRGRDRETGVGRGSFGAPFSDLFRYKLLFEHGGIWADMDVTCLRPFEFKGDYAFRPHRLGVVGSIMKCPKGSRLLKAVYEEAVATVTADSDYLAPNRILSAQVIANELLHYAVPEMSNADNWFKFIQPLIERRVAIPDTWYAIHWINELWRTLQADAGHYRGRKLLDHVPDKDVPLEGTTQWELYRKYGLIDARSGSAARPSRWSRFGERPVAQPIVQLKETATLPFTLNILVPDLDRGSAERIVAETVAALRGLPGHSINVYVLSRSRRQYAIESSDRVRVLYGRDGVDTAATLRGFALDIMRSGTPLAIVHRLPLQQLRPLWGMGIATVPVVHDAHSYDAASLNLDSASIPLVISVADEIARWLRASGCVKPIITVRHELQRAFQPDDLMRRRREIRDRYAIGDEVLLIGMIGAFTAQKAYTRAVQVLHRLKRHSAAKLMILGGWESAFGGSPVAYEAACRRAVELGVSADLIVIGSVQPVESYLAAFDVLLNTSIEEGLNISMLEARQTGCPIVAAAIGANREAVHDAGILIDNGGDIDAYVRAVIDATGKAQRMIPTRSTDAGLVPQLWSLLAQYGSDSGRDHAAREGVLFVTSQLATRNSARTTLVELVSGLAPGCRVGICVLSTGVDGLYKDALDAAQVQIFSAHAGSLSERCRLVLRCAELLKVRSICFFDAAMEVKLLATKVLGGRSMRIVDVIRDLAELAALTAPAAEALQRRAAFSATQYLERLDHLVLTDATLASNELARACPRVQVIQDGLRAPPIFVPLPLPAYLPPPEWNPQLQIGSVCPLTPRNHLDFLLETMRQLDMQLPGVFLTIVGSADDGNAEYAASLRKQTSLPGAGNIWWVNGADSTLPSIAQFQVFITASPDSTSFRTLLEAASIGVPIVASRNSVTTRLLRDGVNGFLVSTPQEMAARVIELLTHRPLRRRIGTTARLHAVRHYSLQEMVQSYMTLFQHDAGMPVLPRRHMRRRAPGRIASRARSGARIVSHDHAG